MFASLKTTTLSAMIALGALSAIPASAQAEGLYLNFGGRGDDARFGVTIGEDGHSWRRHDRRDRRAASCTPDRALDKAERMGIRRARIADVDRNSITVSGRSRGDRIFVTFAKAPRCPIIG